MGRLRAVGIVVAVLLIAACGGDSGKIDVAVIGKGAAATIASRSFRFELTIDGGDRPEVMSGAADLERRLVWMGSGSTDVEIEFIAVGDRYYQASFGLPRSAGATTPWVRHDPAAERARLQEFIGQQSDCTGGGLSITSAELGDEGGASTRGSSSPLGDIVPDPARLLSELKARAASVEQAGTADVRGTSTEIYDVTTKVDPAAVARVEAQIKKLPPEQRELQADYMRASARPPRTRVWIDSDELVRRIEYRQDYSKTDSFRTRYEFFDFGTPVDVNEPPPAEVTPFLSLVRPFGELGCTDQDAQLQSVAWVVAREGETGGTRWFLETGKANDGASCVRVRTDPAEELEPEFQEGTCYDGLTSAGFSTGGSFSYIYGVSPAGTDSARAKYKGGRTGEVIIVGDFWLVLWDDSRVLQSVEFLRKGRVVDVCEDIDNDEGPSC